MVKILNTLLDSLKVLLFNGLFAFIIISLLAFFNFSFAATDEKLKSDETDLKEKEVIMSLLLTKKEALEVAFPGADKIKKDRVWLTKEQILAIEAINMFKLVEKRFTFYHGIKNGKPMGAMLIDNIIGKSFPITFMTVLNTDGTVRDVEIMIYRESQGWEVKYDSFLSQFFGKDSSSDRRKILTITGATLSVNALKLGVYKAMAAYEVLYLNKNNTLASR